MRFLFSFFFIIKNKRVSSSRNAFWLAFWSLQAKIDFLAKINLKISLRHSSNELILITPTKMISYAIFLNVTFFFAVRFFLATIFVFIA